MDPHHVTDTYTFHRHATRDGYGGMTAIRNETRPPRLGPRLQWAVISRPRRIFTKGVIEL